MKRALIALALFAVGGASAQPEQRPVLKIAVTSGGQVVTSDGRVQCHTRCKASYRRGTILRLTAKPDANYLFVRWEGGCIGIARICDIALDRTVSVRARFVGGPAGLRLTVGGPGTITSPSGLNCGGAGIVCGVQVRYASTTTLTPVPSADGRFAAWGDGACAAAGVGPCTLRIESPNTEIAAAFGHSSPQPGPQTLNVNISQASSATVTSDPAGIDCRVTCSASFPSGTLVTLRMSVRDYWYPACQGDFERCLLVLDAPTEVAVWPRPPPPIAPPPRPQGRLQVTVSGGGFIDSGDDVIRCGWSPRVETHCGEVFNLFGTQTKRLRAKTYRPGRFFRWGGVCSRAKPRCAITMTGHSGVQQFPVTALFRRR